MSGAHPFVEMLRRFAQKNRESIEAGQAFVEVYCHTFASGQVRWDDFKIEDDLATASVVMDHPKRVVFIPLSTITAMTVSVRSPGDLKL